MNASYDILNVNRISVIGSPGAGKSTFSRKISSVLQIPVYHLDTVFWLPGWVERSKREFDVLHAEILEKKRWIIDGNYGRTQEWRLRESDVVIFLDFSRGLCLYRALKRQIFYKHKPRSDITEGCEERLEFEFLKYIWRFRNVQRSRILERFENLPNLKIIHLKTPKQLDQYLQNMENFRS